MKTLYAFIIFVIIGAVVIVKPAKKEIATEAETISVEEWQRISAEYEEDEREQHAIEALIIKRGKYETDSLVELAKKNVKYLKNRSYK